MLKCLRSPAPAPPNSVDLRRASGSLLPGVMTTGFGSKDLVNLYVSQGYYMYALKRIHPRSGLESTRGMYPRPATLFGKLSLSSDSLRNSGPYIRAKSSEGVVMFLAAGNVANVRHCSCLFHSGTLSCYSYVLSLQDNHERGGLEGLGKLLDAPLSGRITVKTLSQELTFEC